jgi:orotidine-5'-phosphate decarboxylase
VTEAAARVDELVAAIDRVGTPMCVGLDPVIEKIPGWMREHREPAAAIEVFCRGVIDAVAEVAPAVKPQAACFERWGTPGWTALERTIRAAKEAGLFVVLDAKRGDIGTSAAHYAASAATMGADAVTVNAYLGPSGVEPFLNAGLMVFALVRTSNPDADTVQAAELVDGRTVAEHVGSVVASLGSPHRGRSTLSAVGAVVGATQTGADARPSPENLRAAMPDQVILTPGIGAQGAGPSDLVPLARPGAATIGRAGILAPASRSVTYPSAASEGKAEAWTLAVREAAADLGLGLSRALAPGG